MAAYWLSGPRPGHATISDATQWHHVAHDVERVLADIDTNHGNCSVQCLGHGVLLVLTPLPSILLLAGQEHGRTIPLAEVDAPHSSATAPIQCALIASYFTMRMMKSIC